MQQAARVAFLIAAILVGLSSSEWSLPVLCFCLPILSWLPAIPIQGVNGLNLILVPVLMRALTTRPPELNTRSGGFSSPILIPATIFVVLLTWSWLRVEFDPRVPATFLARDGFGLNLIQFKDTLVAFILYFCARRLTVDVEDRRRTILAIAAAFSFEALTAAKEYFLTSAYRATAHMGQPNKLGHFLAAYAMIPLAFAIVGTGRAKKLGLIGLGVAVAGLFGAVSRGALLAFAGALTLILLIRGSKWFVVAVLAVGLAPVWLPDKVMNRFEELSAGEGEEMTLDQLEEKEGRIRLWEAGLRMIKDNPMGVGMGLFRDRLLDYGFTGRKLKTQHNVYIALASEQGWAAVIAHVWMMLAIALRGWKLMRSAWDEFHVALGFAGVGVVISFLISTNFGSGFYDNNLSGLFWVFAGVVATAYDMAPKRAAGAAS